MIERWRSLEALRRAGVCGLMGVLALGAASCSLDSLLKSDKIPTNVTDPAITKTPDGAMAVYHGTLVRFAQGFAGNGGYPFVVASGLLGDELRPGDGGTSTTPDPFDARLMVASTTETFSAPYSILQGVRGQSGQAIGLLTDFPPPNAAPLVGHMYALQAYAEVMLAELYCSGVPLSTLDYNGDYTLQPASTTSEVLSHAVALFDAALTLTGDSVRFAQLAAVGKGRALLGLGQYAAAAAAVASVTDAFRYDVRYDQVGVNNGSGSFRAVSSSSNSWPYSVADRDGTNGLDYVSSGDPRTASTSSGLGAGTSVYGYPIFVPEKYPDAASPVTLASGIEARLIRAEAALQGGDVDPWLAMLNQLRIDGGGFTSDTIADTLGVTGCGPAICGDPGPSGSNPSKGQPAGGFQVPSGYTLVNSYTISAGLTLPGTNELIWQHCYNYSWYQPCYVNDVSPSAGQTTVDVYVANVPLDLGLAPLTDPGASISDPVAANAARVDLMFRERAFWLFLTGHREGDMRRLIRQYHRTQDQIYPVGAYPSGLGVQYGPAVFVPPPLAEQNLNPRYTGCFPSGA